MNATKCRILILLLLISCGKEKSTPPINKGPYFAKVKSIIRDNCTVTCHSPSQGFLQGLPVILDTDTDIVIRAASIKNAVAGPFNFMTNKQMPLGGQLTSNEVDIISKWLAAGGKSSD